MTLEKYLLFPLLLTVGVCSKQADPPSAREMYDSMSKMVTGSAFPSHWCIIIIIVVIVTTITVMIISINITIVTIVTAITTITAITILTLSTGGRSATPAWLPSRPPWRPRWTRPGRAWGTFGPPGVKKGIPGEKIRGIISEEPSQPRPCTGENVQKEVRRRPQGRDGSRATVRGRHWWRLL